MAGEAVEYDIVNGLHGEEAHKVTLPHGISSMFEDGTTPYL